MGGQPKQQLRQDRFAIRHRQRPREVEDVAGNMNDSGYSRTFALTGIARAVAQA
jgi:hypothetical protein